MPDQSESNNQDPPEEGSQRSSGFRIGRVIDVATITTVLILAGTFIYKGAVHLTKFSELKEEVGVVEVELESAAGRLEVCEREVEELKKTQRLLVHLALSPQALGISRSELRNRNCELLGKALDYSTGRCTKAPAQQQ